MIARRPPVLTLTMLLAAATAQADEPEAPEVAGGMPLVVAADFEAGGLDGWTFTDEGAWRIAEHEGNHVLEQHRQSMYEPEVRSPLNIALAPGGAVGDFVLDVKVRSTGRDYGHRDVCVFFGRRDPSHFYYVHLAKQADEHANSIFLVDGKPRATIAEDRTKGTDWDDAWHHVRVVRKVADGSILVYFDDMGSPAMTAHDSTFAAGRFGVGTFDDTAQFDDLRVWGKPASDAP